jgi:outer membrane lipoprotein-sorting protein
MHRSVSRAVLVVALVFFSAGALPAQTVDEVVAKNLAAKGGADRWRALTSLKVSGLMSIQGKEVPLTIYSKRPNLMRQEIALQDLRMVQAFDGTTAWALHPMGGGAAQELPPAAADALKTSAQFESALIDYKSKGNTVELVGTETVDGLEAHHLKVTLKSGQIQHFYIDAKTGLDARVTHEIDPDGSGKKLFSTELTNYKQVDGLAIPHLVKQSVDGKVVGSMTIDKVEFNSITDDSIFKMPVKPVK